jgi:hypothetical protein
VSAITQKRWIAEVYPDLATAKNFSGFEWTHAWRFQSPPASVWELTENGKVTGLPGSIETTAENAHLIAAAPDLLEALENLVKYEATEVTLHNALVAIAKAKGETP